MLVTSCDPLRIFVYKEGLARFATTAYADPSQSNLVSGERIFFTEECNNPGT